MEQHLKATARLNMALWSMDEWQFLEREVVTDPKGRQWTVALMDVLGQQGDPDMPNSLLELQYSSGRYFTLVYSDGGALAAGARLCRATRSEPMPIQTFWSASLTERRSVAATFRQDLED